MSNPAGRATAALVAAVMLSTAAGAQQTTAADTAATVFDRVTVVDVEHGALVPEQRVVVVGRRIQAVGTASSVALPRAAHVVDAQGKYVIPGLWDMHTHLHMTNLDARAFVPTYIAYGVTGVRDMGADSIEPFQRWRREIAAGQHIGPRIVAAGPFVDGADNDFNSQNDHLLVATPDQGRRVVDSLVAAGVDFIKVYSGLSADVYFAVAAEARRLRVPFAGHQPGMTPEAEVSALEASDSGQRSIEHVNLSGGVGVRTCEQPDSLAEAECAAVAARFVRNGTWWTPTMVTWKDELRELGIETVTRMHRAGMPLLAGAENADNVHGLSLQQELALFVKAGLTPLEALRTATLNPARYFNGSDSLGTVVAGKVADLVLLDADPLADIANTLKIHAVMAAGRYYDRAVLDRLLADDKRHMDEAMAKAIAKAKAEEAGDQSDGQP